MDMIDRLGVRHIVGLNFVVCFCLLHFLLFQNCCRGFFKLYYHYCNIIIIINLIVITKDAINNIICIYRCIKKKNFLANTEQTKKRKKERKKLFSPAWDNDVTTRKICASSPAERNPSLNAWIPDPLLRGIRAYIKDVCDALISEGKFMVFAESSLWRRLSTLRATRVNILIFLLTLIRIFVFFVGLVT